jgi:DNA polymerase
MSAQEWVPESPSLTGLRSAIQECRGCELYADATHAVMGEGREGSRLVLLGEQPGDREDVEGEPFVGPAGKLLDQALAEAGIDPAETYRTNAVKHFRWKGTRGKRRIHQSPTSKHVAACAPWLRAELALLRPEGVVLLGSTAGRAVFGSSFRVGEMRGSRVDWPASAYPLDEPPGWVLATTHPSAVLRSDDRDAAYGELVADLRVAVEG